MNKLEYSDFYRFLVSLGVVLISFALLLPWLFLHESFDTLVTTSDLINLTSTAQLLINYRQTTALWFLRNIIWISPLLAGTGIVFLSGGTYLWYSKQKLLDQKEQLETEKLRLEVKSMTPEQIAAKVIKETVEEIRPEMFEKEATIIDSSQSYVAKYFRVERTLIDKMTTCFGVENVFTHQKVRDKELDIILTRSPKEEDTILSLKLIHNPNNIVRRIRETTNLLISEVRAYKIATNRKAIGVGLFVFANSYPDELPRDDLSKILDEQALISDTSVHLHIITEEELPRLHCNDKIFDFSSKGV